MLSPGLRVRRRPPRDRRRRGASPEPSGEPSPDAFRGSSLAPTEVLSPAAVETTGGRERSARRGLGSLDAGAAGLRDVDVPERLSTAGLPVPALAAGTGSPGRHISADVPRETAALPGTGGNAGRTTGDPPAGATGLGSPPFPLSFFAIFLISPMGIYRRLSHAGIPHHTCQAAERYGVNNPFNVWRTGSACVHRAVPASCAPSSVHHASGSRCS